MLGRNKKTKNQSVPLGFKIKRQYGRTSRTSTTPKREEGSLHFVTTNVAATTATLSSFSDHRNFLVFPDNRLLNSQIQLSICRRIHRDRSSDGLNTTKLLVFVSSNVDTFVSHTGDFVKFSSFSLKLSSVKLPRRLTDRILWVLVQQVT